MSPFLKVNHNRVTLTYSQKQRALISLFDNFQKKFCYIFINRSLIFQTILVVKKYTINQKTSPLFFVEIINILYFLSKIFYKKANILSFLIFFSEINKIILFCHFIFPSSTFSAHHTKIIF